MKIAFIFPGQGSQEVGMGRELFLAHPQAHSIFEEADRILGWAVSQICFEGPAETLIQTINTQPAIFTTSIACFQAMLAAGLNLRPKFVAGHSLGEYTALVVAGAIDFPTGLRLVAERGKLMQAAGEENPGVMAAVLGLGDEIVEAIVLEVDSQRERLAVANYNSPGQVVISGEKQALERAMQLARERGASRVLPLAVSIAAHSPLMASAAEGMAKALGGTKIETARIPVIANLTAQPIVTPDEIRSELVRQLLHGVEWTKTIVKMVEQGVDTFLELGPGRVLAGLVKRITPQAGVYNVSDQKSLEKTIAELASEGHD